VDAVLEVVSKSESFADQLDAELKRLRAVHKAAKRVLLLYGGGGTAAQEAHRVLAGAVEAVDDSDKRGLG
jgi:ABC-type hemin transport system substrate-binding protein